MHHNEKGKDDSCDCGNCENCENCTDGNCNCGCGYGGGYKKAKLYFFAGILAIVYGVINFLITSVGWPAYQAWIVGGVILLLVGSLKKHMMR